MPHAQASGVLKINILGHDLLVDGDRRFAPVRFDAPQHVEFLTARVYYLCRTLDHQDEKVKRRL